MTRNGGESPNERHTRVGWRLAGLAGETASMVLGGLVLGWGISQFMESRTWIVVGGVAGVVTGIMTLIRGSLKLNAEMDRDSGIGIRNSKNSSNSEGSDGQRGSS